MVFKRCLLGMTVLVLLFSAQAFSQNGTITGTVTDASQGVLPGATIKVTNTGTGIVQTYQSNAAGIFSAPGLPAGQYKVSAEMSGFGTQEKTGVALGPRDSLRINFELSVAEIAEVVQVSVETENILLENTSSVGVVLQQEKLAELPLVNNNVLDLVKVMGGVTMTESAIFGADNTTFGGLGANNINLQRDGVTVNDVRWTTGLSSPVSLSPELIGEFKMVLAPVDAEMGRGAGQVQVITRSGANEYRGSGVWNIQNSVLDANHWTLNRTGTPPNWRNQEEYTLSIGGPIIKNKTFFFALWDHQIARMRDTAQPVIPTACARKGIYRYFEGWNSVNRQATTLGAGANSARFSPGNQISVDANGRPVTNMPVQPAYMGATAGRPSTLQHTSVFGRLRQTIAANDYDCAAVTVDPATGLADSSWVEANDQWGDPLRTADTTGYVKRFLALAPGSNKINTYDVGDGLNFGGYRWTRTAKGIDNVYGLGEGPNKKQISFKIDHNFNSKHRISGSYSYESTTGEDNQATWPTNSFGNIITRKPQTVSINFTSTLKPTLLNEFRFGLSRSASVVWSPIDSPENGTKLRKMLYDLMPTAGFSNAQGQTFAANLPVLVGLGGSNGGNFHIGNEVWMGANPGSHPYGASRGNISTTWGGHDPRYTYGDTVTWMRGKHSFKFGGETQRSQSWQRVNGSVSFSYAEQVLPYVMGGATAANGNKGLFTQAGPVYTYTHDNVMPGLTGTATAGTTGGLYNLLNMYAGSVKQIGQWFYANKPTDMVYNDLSKGEGYRIMDYRQNQFSLFGQDDWKVTDNLTLTLGLRYEWYGVPYLSGGLSAGLTEGALAVFGRSGRSFADWMTLPTGFNPNAPGSFTYKGADAAVSFVGPESPNPNRVVYNDDYNNFGPVFGFAYQLPWFGKGKTTIRGGYQMSYLPSARGDAAASNLTIPSISRSWIYKAEDRVGEAAYMNLSSIRTLLPLTVPAYMKTPAAQSVVPVDQRQSAINVYDPNLRSPYTHILTLQVSRSIGSNLTAEVKYLGQLTRKQTNSINLNSANFLNNGLKEAFDAARRGENPALLDNMFRGVTLVDTTRVRDSGVVGSTVNGVYQSGALHLRQADATRTNLANGNYASLASTIATMNINTGPGFNPTLEPAPAYSAGQILRRNGFPENFILTSPQFSAANFTGNFDNANYHSMQAQLDMRPLHGFSMRGTYTWARNLGALSYVDPRNRALDHGLNSMHRSHAFTLFGSYDLPFGPGRSLFSNVSPNIVGRIIGGWQLTWIHSMQTGHPMTISAGNTSLYAATTPNLVGSFDTKQGHVSWAPNARYGNYFNGRYTMVRDPQCTNAALVDQTSLGAFCTLGAYADAQNNNALVLVNPLPGQRGSFGRNNLTSPLTWDTSMALMKQVRITESKSFQLRIDATNVFNHAQASNGVSATASSRNATGSDPSMTMSSTYGVFTTPGRMDSKIGVRTFQARLRFDF